MDSAGGPVYLSPSEFNELRRLCEKLAFATGASLPPRLDSIHGLVTAMDTAIEIAGKRVTRGKSDQKRLREARDEAVRVEELKARFIRSVSHELRTPLASIEGFARALLNLETAPAADPEAQSEQRRQFLGIICREAQRLEDMVEAVLELNEAESCGNRRKPAVFRARDAFDEALKSLEPGIRRSPVSLELHPAPDGPLLFAERAAVVEIIRQLLNNAQKFSAGQAVVLGAEMLAEGEAIPADSYGVEREAIASDGARERSVRGNGSAPPSTQRRMMARLSVRDKGVGIAPEELSQVFDRFHRGRNASASFPGHGLGLALVRTLVNQCNGRVWVESELGRGSTFHVALPSQAQP